MIFQNVAPTTNNVFYKNIVDQLKLLMHKETKLTHISFFFIIHHHRLHDSDPDVLFRLNMLFFQRASYIFFFLDCIYKLILKISAKYSVVVCHPFYVSYPILIYLFIHIRNFISIDWIFVALSFYSLFMFCFYITESVLPLHYLPIFPKSIS